MRSVLPAPQAVCDAWSAKLAGQRFHPDRIHHIQALALGLVRPPGSHTGHGTRMCLAIGHVRGPLTRTAAACPFCLQEHTFTTVEGPRSPLPFKRGGSENS